MLPYRLSARYLLRHPWLLTLAVLGVALGVAVVVGIDLANSGARTAFELSADVVAGKSTHQIRAASGWLRDDVYRKLRVENGVQESAPVVESYVRLENCEGRVLRLLGIDPLVDSAVRNISGKGALDLSTLMMQPAAVLETSLVLECGFEVGDTLSLRVDGRAVSLNLSGTLTASDERSRVAFESVMITDLSTAQEMLDRAGALSRIDVVLPPDSASQEEVRAMLPEGTVLVNSESRTDTLAQMTRAFDVNLRALSLLALVVGMFLIYNSMAFSVVQRRPLIGRLRALGMTRRQIFGLILGEAAVIGVAGTAAGILLGVLLASGLLDLVTRSINDLYFVLTVRRLEVAPLTLLKGLAIGVGVTVLAAVRPAWEATTVPVTVVLQRSAV
jgi:putative ABC transport system permease protein